MLVLIAVTLLTGYIAYKYYSKTTKPESLKDKLDIPTVEGSLPFIGHALSFRKDILGFVRNASLKYGKVFKMKIVNKEMVVVCDRTLLKDFFKATEDKMSLYDVLEGLFFDSAFSDDPNSMRTIIGLIKETIALRYEEFAPKIIDQAEKMVKRIKNSNTKCDLTSEMIRFVSATSAKCFMGYDINDEFFEALMKFTHLLNKIIVLTYFMPKWMLRIIYGKQLKSYRMIMSNILSPEINKYRHDLAKNESLIFRRAVDFIGENGNKLNNEEIGGIITCLLYISSENTSLGASASLVDLALNPEWWNKVKEETENLLKNNDINGLFKSELINSCVIESGRMNVHIFPLNRKPKSTESCIGDYYIGDAQIVGVCEPMLMTDIYAEDVFKNPKCYNPGRFMGENPEPKDSAVLLTFGDRVHKCPGRMFAIYEIIAAIAMTVSNFERFDLKREKMPELDYFSPSAFSERHVDVEFKALQNIIKRDMTQNNNVLMPLKPKYTKKNIIRYENGWLIKGFLSNEINMFKYTLEMTKNSKEHMEILNVPKKTAYPIMFYNLVYTGTSNCEKPDLWLSAAETAWEYLISNNEITEEIPEFNSVYAQMFDTDSVMADHYDQGVDWGVSFSLGASCDFRFGEGKIILDSGDAFIADFSKVLHGVPKVHINASSWVYEDNDFNRTRMSIQVRNVKNYKSMPENEFKKMLKSY